MVTRRADGLCWHRSLTAIDVPATLSSALGWHRSDSRARSRMPAQPRCGDARGTLGVDRINAILDLLARLACTRPGFGQIESMEWPQAEPTLFAVALVSQQP